MQAKQLALQRAAERAAEQDAHLAASRASAAELEAQVADLRLFVDVLLAAAPESRSIAELQAAQARLGRDLEASFFSHSLFCSSTSLTPFMDRYKISARHDTCGASSR